MPMLNEVKVRDFCIFILCYGRADVAKKYTWELLDKMGSKRKRFIICSTDDKTIDDYYKTFGKENVLLFDKNIEEERLNIDLVDCYHNHDDIKKGTVWARNACFNLARKAGYRFFMVFDDDVASFCIRNEIELGKSKNHILSQKITLSDMKCFDELSEYYFKILDSAPWLNSVAYSQCGDYIGGVGSSMWRNGFTFKAMNIFFCDTEKEHRYYGRMNDDVNAYCLNGSRGRISFTPSGPALNQLQTQQVKGGMTEMYRSFGTWMKSIYSVVLCPSFVSIGRIGNTYESSRIHHNISWKCAIPKIISSRYSKNGYVDYKKDVMNDLVILDEEGKLVIPHGISFLDDECPVFENKDVLLSNNLMELF